jgi:hypothetical protein
MRFVTIGGLLMASVERPLSAPPTVGYGSGPGDRAAGLSGGSTIDTSPSCSDYRRAR